MYTAYKLSRVTIYSLDIVLNFEPDHCFMSGSNCCFLTCIQDFWETGKVVWYSNLVKNFPQFVVKLCFSVVSEAEVDVLLEFPCFSYDPTNVGSLISDSSAFSKPSLNNWKFSVYVLLKPSVKNFEHYFPSV